MRDAMAPFHRELLEVLDEVNSRSLGRSVSFRSAVVNGMIDNEGNALRDSFTSKIKDGTYRPTFDRIVNLARFLNISPTRFQVYRQRYAQRLLENPIHQELVALLASTSDEVADTLLEEAVKNMRTVLTTPLEKDAEVVA